LLRRVSASTCSAAASRCRADAIAQSFENEVGGFLADLGDAGRVPGEGDIQAEVIVARSGVELDEPAPILPQAVGERELREALLHADGCVRVKRPGGALVRLQIDEKSVAEQSPPAVAHLGLRKDGPLQHAQHRDRVDVEMHRRDAVQSDVTIQARCPSIGLDREGPFFLGARRN
jgi:hypothetical protein